MKVGVGLAATALLATACGGSSKGSSSTSGGKTAASSYNAAVTADVNASTKKGGVLKLGAAEDFDSLDPGRTYFGYVWNFRRLWDRQMFQFAPVPGKGSLTLAPDLAVDAGKASADAKTYTYKIRTGVKFANGTVITTKDIKYGIERIFAQDVISGGPTYLVDLLDPDKKYKGPYKDKAGLSTIETPDDQTIIFHLAKPFSDMNYLLALPSSTPVPAAVDQVAATGGANYFKHPISAGPYQVDSYSPGKSLKLIRNPNWDPKTDPLHKALPDSIEVTIGIAPDTLDSQLLAGQLDLVLDQNLQPAARAKVISGKTGVGKNADNPVSAYTTQWIDVNKTVITDVHCRRAIAYAINKKSLQDVYGGADVGGVLATSVTPPSSLSFEKDYNPYPSGADSTGDLTKAKDELKQCGKPNGFNTKLAARKTGFGPKVAVSVQAALKRVGINVTYVGTTRAADPAKTPAQVKAQGLGIVSFNWGADFPTDYGFYEFVADPRSILPSGNYNQGNFDDPKGATLIDDALKKSGGDQQAVWKDFSHLLMDSGTAVPYLYPKQLQAHSARLTNVHCLEAIFGEYDFMNIGVL